MSGSGIIDRAADSSSNQAGGRTDVQKTTKRQKKWAAVEIKELERLAAQNTPTRVIGLKLGRTEDSVRSKAQDENISLKPTNQSPYGNRG
jgi:hypothetical protein